MAEAPRDLSQVREGELLRDVLRSVSRSFYLTLRILPGPVRAPIGLAYLLARTTDTIADTDAFPPETRIEALRWYEGRIDGSSERAWPRFQEFVSKGKLSPAERVLLERAEEILCCLRRLPAADQERITRVLSIITSGQTLDLERFRGATVSSIAALETLRDLDDYTYRVAGCVGEFWTYICRAHLFARASLDDAELLVTGVRFGKGLQLVNILRDVPEDLRRGRCYLPADRLRALGLKPGDLLDPAGEARLRPFYDELLGLADAHLAAGWRYTNLLPWRAVRVRLACAWPILIGAATVERLRKAHVLNPTERVKITRREVRRLMARSLLAYPWPSAWARLVPFQAEKANPIASPSVSR